MGERWDVINRFIRPESRYLEIGVDQGETWRRVNCVRKIGIDPDSRFATHHMTSDEFFACHDKACCGKFDVIFVDGLHLQDQVARDVENSFGMLAFGGVIVMHDVIPRTMKHAQEERIAPEWYGTVWKAAVALAFNPHVDFTVVEIPGGCGILREGTQEIPSILPELALDPAYFFENARNTIYRMVP